MNPDSAEHGKIPDEGEIIDASTIDMNLISLKEELLAVRIPGPIQRHSLDPLPVETSFPKSPGIAADRNLRTRIRRKSWPGPTLYNSTKCSVDTQPSNLSFDLDIDLNMTSTPNLRELIPLKSPILNRSTSQPTLIKSKSILKSPQTPKSQSSKTVKFDDNEERRELEVWYHIDSPRKSKFPHLPSKSSHTLPGSEFSTNLDDSTDFGPNHNPDPVFLSDYDYQYTDEASESLCEYMCAVL